MSGLIDIHGNPLRATVNYEGATKSPRSVNWSASSDGPNRALKTAGASLRNRARAGYRNSLLLRSAINKNTTNEVGKGFTVMSLCKDDDFSKSANDLWKIVSTELDPWGGLNFGGIVNLAVKSRRMSGECFIVRLPRPISSKLTVPVQVELYEADMCPVSFYKRLSANRVIKQGIEFSGKHKVAYWFYRVHPNDDDDKVSLNRLYRVPARDVIHHYHPNRPGQIRSEPETSAALLKDRTFSEYDDAELTRKKERSAFTGFLYREQFGEDWEFDPQTGIPLFDDSAPAETVQQVRSGTILRGVAGEKLDLFDGDDTGQGYKDFVRWQGLQISAGLDIPYPLLTGDWEGLNDRLVRAFLNEYRRGISFDQTNLSGFQVVFGIWRWVINVAITTGKLDAANYEQNPHYYLALDIRPDAFKHLHPVQDIDARNKAVFNNISNAESEAAEYGRDLDDNMRRNAKARKRWEQICKEEGIEPSNLAGLFSAQETIGAE